jgi:hypothetical protein
MPSDESYRRARSCNAPGCTEKYLTHARACYELDQEWLGNAESGGAGQPNNPHSNAVLTQVHNTHARDRSLFWKNPGSVFGWQDRPSFVPVRTLLFEEFSEVRAVASRNGLQRIIATRMHLRRGESRRRGDGWRPIRP